MRTTTTTRTTTTRTTTTRMTTTRTTTTRTTTTRMTTTRTTTYAVDDYADDDHRYPDEDYPDVASRAPHRLGATWRVLPRMSPIGISLFRIRCGCRLLASEGAARTGRHAAADTEGAAESAPGSASAGPNRAPDDPPAAGRPVPGAGRIPDQGQRTIRPVLHAQQRALSTTRSRNSGWPVKKSRKPTASSRPTDRCR